MFIDWLGGLFSLLSLLFKEKLDVLASVTYSLVVVGVIPIECKCKIHQLETQVLDGVVLLLAIILHPFIRRAWRRSASLNSNHSLEESPITTVACDTPEAPRPVDDATEHKGECTLEKV